MGLRDRIAHFHLLPLALFAALALWAAWPLWAAPASRLEDLGDPLLNSWILYWDHFALFHQCADFFQANVYWPHESSLAYGEHMFTQAILALPLRLVTTHPVALHNLSVVQGYFLSAVGAWLLGLYYFRASLPATLAGLIYGFAAYRVNQGAHLQLIHGEFLPLMILAFERVLTGGGRRWGWALGLAALGQWLTSWYWAVFSFWCVVPLMVFRFWQARRELTPRRLAAVVVPFLIAGALALPLAWPYLRLKRDGYLVRPPEAATSFAAHPADYLVPTRRSLLYANLNYFARYGGGGAERALFPGLALTLAFAAALALALKRSDCGLRSRRSTGPSPLDCGLKENAENELKEINSQSAIRNPQSAIENSAFRIPHFPFPLRFWAVLTLVMLSFTFGASLKLGSAATPHTFPLPLALLRWFPLADQMRVPARWMLPALLGFALLAAEVWRRLAAARWRGARTLAIVFFCFFAAESLTRPAAFESLPSGCPAAIDWLNAQPNPSPVMILPPAYDLVMLEAAWLRQPLLNGTNGYFPPAHIPILKALAAGFPEPAAVEALRGIGIRFVLINLDEARKPSLAWDPSRLPTLLKSLPASLSPVQRGPYLVLDLGAPETDMQKIGIRYNQLERQIRLARQRPTP